MSTVERMVTLVQARLEDAPSAGSQITYSRERARDAPSSGASQLPRVPRLQEGLLVSRMAGLDLAPALDLGVELGAEEHGDVRDVEPHQEGDDAAEGAVCLVVVGEAGDIEGERSGS